MGTHAGAGSSGLKPHCQLLTHYLARLHHLPSTPLFFSRFLDTHKHIHKPITFPEVQHKEIVWLCWIPVHGLVQLNNPSILAAVCDFLPQIHSEQSQKNINNWKDSEGIGPQL